MLSMLEADEAIFLAIAPQGKHQTFKNISQF